MSTPIEKVRNIGAGLGEALRSVGIKTQEDFENTGWDGAWDLLRKTSAEFNSPTVARALAAAEFGEDPKDLPPDVLKHIERRWRQKPA
jgi:hypothetical protein